MLQCTISGHDAYLKAPGLAGLAHHLALLVVAQKDRRVVQMIRKVVGHQVALVEDLAGLLVGLANLALHVALLVVVLLVDHLEGAVDLAALALVECFGTRWGSLHGRNSHSIMA